MFNPKLDLKDMRILDVLDKSPNISTSALAKKVGVSRQVAEYRVNKLKKQNTIYAFYSLVDVGRLGYSNFRVHLRLRNVTEEVYSEFAKEVFTNYPCFWVAFISGSFDLIIDIFARNSNEFEEIFSGIIKKHKDIIQSYERMVILEMELYTYSYFLEQSTEGANVMMHRNTGTLDLDATDRKILKAIKYDSRMPFQAIGSKVGMSRTAVKQRIKKLEQQKVIAGYKAFVNFNHFNKDSFKIFIKYNNARLEQEDELLKYLKGQPGILASLKLLGKWNLDIEVHKENVKELQKFIMGMRNKFEIIEDYEIVQIIEDYGIDFFPAKLS